MEQNFKKQTKDLLNEYLHEVSVSFPGDESILKYHKKKVSVLVKLETGQIYCINKPDIETKFCFGYGCFGPSAYKAGKMCETAKNDTKYFMDENLRDIDKVIKTLLDQKNNFFTRTMYYRASNIAQIELLNNWDDLRTVEKQCTNVRPLSTADREKVIQAYQAARALFVKRLETYLKKYGLSKITVWSYWMDD